MLDHAAIILMIAGTYTPFILIKMQTPWGLGLLAVVWTMAAIGIAIKLFAPRFLDGLSTALYLVQGWAVIVAWQPLMSALPGVALTLLMICGSGCRIRTPSGTASCCRRRAATSPQ